jgi:hypothetical protein
MVFLLDGQVKPDPPEAMSMAPEIHRYRKRPHTHSGFSAKFAEIFRIPVDVQADEFLLNCT